MSAGYVQLIRYEIFMKRLLFGIASVVLFAIEIIIGIFATGWIRNYLGDVLVVVLLYTIFRTISPDKPDKWFVIPSAILLFSFVVELLQLWGFCDRFGITNPLLRIIIGTGFSYVDLACYTIGLIPCYIADYLLCKDIRKKAG